MGDHFDVFIMPKYLNVLCGTNSWHALRVMLRAEVLVQIDFIIGISIIFSMRNRAEFATIVLELFSPYSLKRLVQQAFGTAVG